MIKMIMMMITIRACMLKRTRKKKSRKECIKTSGKRGEASVER